MMQDIPEDVWLLLDLIPFGIVFLSSSHRVLGMNRRAQALLREADAARFDGSHVRATDLLLDAQLQSALASRRTAVLRLRRLSKRRALEVAVIQLSEACALLFADSVNVVLNHLRTLYGLTPTEARVVAAVVRGDGGAAAASELGMSVNTFRRHLKSIFVKVDVDRQPELVRVVCSGVAVLGADPGAADGTRMTGGV